jgi:hypothetical protein
MDWFFELLDLLFVAGQVSACLWLLYGGYLSIWHSSLSSIPDPSAALSAAGRQGRLALS